LLWEIGHVAWFQEKWVLRRDGRPSLCDAADSLYDSAAIPHDVRWDLSLLRRQQTYDYMQCVLDHVLERVHSNLDAGDAYFMELAVYHEDMHAEAFAITRQTLGYPAPAPSLAVSRSQGPSPGDVRVPGGTYFLGATPDEPFVFDNEKWAHRVEIAPFAIARAPVTQAEFAAFVDDGGYQQAPVWSAEGWDWRLKHQAGHPLYWERGGAGCG